jgi:hypothetical protein
VIAHRHITAHPPPLPLAHLRVILRDAEAGPVDGRVVLVALGTPSCGARVRESNTLTHRTPTYRGKESGVVFLK